MFSWVAFEAVPFPTRNSREKSFVGPELLPQTEIVKHGWWQKPKSLRAASDTDKQIKRSPAPRRTRTKQYALRRRVFACAAASAIDAFFVCTIDTIIFSTTTIDVSTVYLVYIYY